MAGKRDKPEEIVLTDAYVSSSYARKKAEMLFAHLKRITGLDRLRLRGANGAKDEFHLALAVQNLRKLAKLRPMPVLGAGQKAFAYEASPKTAPTFSTESGQNTHWLVKQEDRRAGIPGPLMS
jgi:hypothetical protein